MTAPLSRREFFGQAPASAAAGLAASQPPPQAWIIMEVDWKFHGEYSFAEGERAGFTLYYDRSAVDAECRRLNDEFYGRETPDEFQLDWAFYFPDDLPHGKSEVDITWDDVKAVRGWRDPYFVRELTVPGDHGQRAP